MSNAVFEFMNDRKTSPHPFSSGFWKGTVAFGKQKTSFQKSP
jgi:hypothetical protein